MILQMLLLAAFSFRSHADWQDPIETRIVCTEVANPSAVNANFIEITYYKGLPSSHSGAIERFNGGRGPGDFIECPQIRVSSSIDETHDSAGNLTGFHGSNVVLEFKGELTPGAELPALVTDNYYKLAHHPMLCRLADRLPFRCTPHDYSGE